jgi:hypothetical protein
MVEELRDLLDGLHRVAPELRRNVPKGRAVTRRAC